MKKYLLLIMSLFIALYLVACGKVVTEKKQVESVSTAKDEQSSDVVEQVEETEDESEIRDFNEVIADTDNLKATLISIEKVVDTTFNDEYYNVNIEIENKREDTIEVQAREASADGRMIDDMIVFSETVAGGKIADATMRIKNYDGDLPPLEDNLEFILHPFSFDDYEFEDDTKVIIEMQ